MVLLYEHMGKDLDYPEYDFYCGACAAPVIYEGTWEIHTVTQAEYVLGYREDKQLNKKLQAWDK